MPHRELLRGTWVVLHDTIMGLTTFSKPRSGPSQRKTGLLEGIQTWPVILMPRKDMDPERAWWHEGSLSSFVQVKMTCCSVGHGLATKPPPRWPVSFYASLKNFIRSTWRSFSLFKIMFIYHIWKHSACSRYQPTTERYCVWVCMGAWSLSRVRLLATLWTVACQATLFMGFPRQEYWSGLPSPSPGDLPHPGIELGSPAWQADSLPRLCRTQ